MYQTRYYVDKRTDTSADTLVAAGFAKLVREVLLRADKPTDDLRLVDKGPYYQIELPIPIEPDDIAHIEYLTLMRHMDVANQQQSLGEHYGRGFPYEQQREIRDTYREKMKQLPSDARTPDARLFGHPALDQLAQTFPPPDAFLPLYIVISEMKVAASFNEPVIRWRELTNNPPLLQIHVELLLELFSTYPNPLDQAIARWRELTQTYKLGDVYMTLLQVINPTTGKGANSRKASGLTTNRQQEFWLLELLKFAGFFVLAHPQRIIDTNDRKTYILHPRSIRFSVLSDLMETFRDVLWSTTPAKLDILAVLQFTRVIVEYDRRALKRQTESKRHRASSKPTDRIHGLDVTFYKHMGSAHNVMNIATLNLPDWVPSIKTVADSDRALAVLNEHIKVIRSIRAKAKQTRNEKEGAEEHEMLRHYRDFVSGQTIDAFLEFAALFAPYLSQKIERDGYKNVSRFSEAVLKELVRMTKHDFMPVITSSGFQHISAAIRQSTVTLQYKKGMKVPVPFDIRYGLLHELVRRSNHPQEFIEVLSEFVTSYNHETAQTFETSKGAIRRKRVSQDDLREIVQLIAQGFSSKTVARLLVAFGSAKASDDPEEPGNDPELHEADDLSSDE